MLKILISFSCIISFSFSNPAIRLLSPKKPRIYKSIKKNKTGYSVKKIYTIKTNKVIKKRRISKLEKELITSKGAKNIRFHNRTVVKRRVYNCSKSNIALMLKGRAPFGFDNKRINLHHLKQQQHGHLVELSTTEHNHHSRILHRYTRVSDISDRNSGYSKFRQAWWRSRASSCIARRK